MRHIVFPVLLIVCLLVGVASAQEMDCAMCHADKAEGTTVHAAVKMGCTACHTGVDASQIPHVFTRGSSKGLMADGADLCYACHSGDKFTGKTSVHAPVMAGMCTSCHDPHASANEKLLVSDRLCYVCHDEASFTSKATVHPPVAGNLCTGCHEPHQSDHEKLLLAEMPDLCYECHDKTKFYAPTVHSPVALGLCTTCHEPHQSDTANLLIVRSPDLCYTCHDESKFKLKGSQHEPVTEGKCLFCHRPHAGPNSGLVYRKGNILCRRCHADIERQPHVASGFQQSGHPLRGRKDPNRPRRTFGCLSCHVPHSSDYPWLFRFKAQESFELCGYCHEL